MSTNEIMLGELCEILNGYAFDSSGFSTSEGFPLIRIRDMKNSRCSLRFVGEFDEKYIVRDGDLLIGMDGEFDIYEWQGEPALLNQRVCKLIPKEKLLDRYYLLHKLKSDLKEIEKNTPSTTVKHISSSQIIGIKWTDVPDISSQKKMGVLISQDLKLIEKARNAAHISKLDINRLRYLTLKSLFIQVEGTIKFCLGDKAPTTSGSTPSRSQKDYWEPAEIPWIKTGEIVYAQITKSEEHVSKKALKECSLKLLPVNTVLIAMYGQGKTRGQSAILKVPATINQACFAILPNETWDSEFLQLWLMYSYQDLRNMSENRGGNQANMNGDLLNSLEVPAPSLDVQKEIVQKANAALVELNAVKNSLEATIQDIKTLPNRILEKAFKID